MYVWSFGGLKWNSWFTPIFWFFFRIFSRVGQYLDNNRNILSSTPIILFCYFNLLLRLRYHNLTKRILILKSVFRNILHLRMLLRLLVKIIHQTLRLSILKGFMTIFSCILLALLAGIVSCLNHMTLLFLNINKLIIRSYSFHSFYNFCFSIKDKSNNYF